MAGQTEETITLDISGLNNGIPAFIVDAGTSPQCPQCRSKNAWRDGLRYQNPESRIIQRWLCRECGLRFSDPNTDKRTAAVVETVETVETKQLKRRNDKVTTRQIGVKETKNLDPQQNKDVVEISQSQTHQTTIQGEIVNFLWYLKKKGKFSDATIKTRVKLLRYLSEKSGINLHDPEAVRTILATNEKWTNGYKQNFVSAYDSFAEMLKISWEPPYYENKKSLPFVP